MNDGDWDDSIPDLVDSESEEERDIPPIDDDVYDEVEDILSGHAYLNLGGGQGATTLGEDYVELYFTPDTAKLVCQKPAT